MCWWWGALWGQMTYFDLFLPFLECSRLSAAFICGPRGPVYWTIETTLSSPALTVGADVWEPLNTFSPPGFGRDRMENLLPYCHPGGGGFPWGFTHAGWRLAHLLWTAADLAPAPTVWFDQLLLEEETESEKDQTHVIMCTMLTSCHYDRGLVLTCLSMTGWALVLRKWIIWQEKDHYYLQGDGC